MESNPKSSGAVGCGDGWRGRLVRVLGTSFGLGFMPKAPGTWGTLPAVAMFLAVALWVPAGWQTLTLGAMLAATSAACVVLGNWAEKVFGREDPGQFVLDEVAGFLLTVLIFHPAKLLVDGHLAGLTVWAFAVTRVMDIIKVPPARQMESLPGGWGILLDDLMASLYAAGLLHLIYWACPELMRW
jgi:phosphatidylglycerophosphatase A